MIRPPRNSRRFQGEGTTSLSNPYAEADGRRLRRRYAVYAVLLILLIVGIVMGVKKSSTTVTTKKSTPHAPEGSYLLESQSTVSDMQSHVSVFRHKKSGMPILAVVPDDARQDAVFGINFRTKVEDNSGIAYVVQKAIQDGSKNFNIKNPFHQLARGSLQTHMETWIEKDRSGFAYASRNLEDFRNGVKVYLDGIFKPNLMADDYNWIFRQEAWRFIRTGPDRNILALGGNAMTEAKAAQMNPDLAHENYVYARIFEGHQYEFMQKGDFREVVTLTRKKLKDFYTKYYHPSNGQAFCYGPQDFVDECLDLMEPYLAEYEGNDHIRKASEVGFVEIQSIKSIQEKVPYPSYEDTGDFRLAVTYVLNDQPMDDRTKMAWFVIADLLFGNPSSVIPRVVAELNLGDDGIGNLQSNLRQWVLTIGSSGILTEQKVGEARIRLQQRLLSLVTDGFDESALRGTLNKLAMQFREQSSKGAPRGVTAFKDVLTTWNYDDDPRKPLSYSKAFGDLKKEIEEKGQDFLLQLVTKRMVDNEHMLSTELFPSTDLLNVYKEQEQSWLDNIDNFVSKEQGLQILSETTELKKVQEEPDSREVLQSISTLTVSDLRSLNFEIPTKIYQDIFDSGIVMLEHTLLHTNGIAYVDFSIDVSNMDFDDVVLLPFFCQLLLQGGNMLKTGIELQRQIDTWTGGLTIQPLVDEIVATGSDGSYVVPSGQHMVTKIVVRTSCLAETGCRPMFDLIKQVLFDADLEKQSVAIGVLNKMIDDMEDDIQLNAHKYSTYRVQSQYGLPGFIREQWLGITQLLNLRRSLYQAKNDWSTLSMRLVLMADAMRRGNRNGMSLSLTGDMASIKSIATGIQAFAKDILPGAAQASRFPNFGTTVHPWYTKGSKRMSDEINAEGENEAFLVPSRLNAVAKGGVLFEIGEPIRGSDLVVLQYIGGYFLYNELRFGQDAQDAQAIVDIDTGSVVYQSNQDPNIALTLEVYDQGAPFVLREMDGKTSLPPEAEGAVIGAIGQIDGTAMQPSEIGLIALVQYLRQETLDSRQVFRNQILSSNVASFLAMTDRLGGWGKPSIAVITNRDEYDAAVADGLTFRLCDITGTSC